MALDFEIKRLYAVAASPELYPVMVQLGTVREDMKGLENAMYTMVVIDLHSCALLSSYPPFCLCKPVLGP